MERFIKGDNVHFPFSDLTSSKKRLALVLANSTLDDVILCQITSKFYDEHGVQLELTDFISGSLNRPSLIRPNRIFTASHRIILYKIGTIKPDKFIQVRNTLVTLLDK